MKSVLFPTILLSLLGFSQASIDSHAQMAKRSQLLARQSIEPSNVPPGCETQCAAILADTNRCKYGSGATCFCNDTVEKDFVNCVDCIVAANGSEPADIKKYQSQVDQFANICAQGGYTLPAMTVVPATGVSANPKPTGTTSSAPTSAAPSATPTGNSGLRVGEGSGLTLALGGLVGALVAL